jgi:hypothetical protein
MVDIGIVGLDTSHAESFATEITERESASVEGVWDGGAVRDEAYVETFCERHGTARYDDPHAMIGDIDAALVLTVNWDTHRELAVPFLENEVATLIDKPIAGTLADIRALEAAVDGTPFFGGSAVPFHSNVRSFSLEPNGHGLYCVGFDDPFYYGVHLVDTICRIVDEPWATVYPANDPGETVDIVFQDGTYVTIRLDSPGNEEQFTFFKLDNSASTAEIGSTHADLDDMYATYVDTFIQVVTGRHPPDTRVLDAATLLLGVDAALQYGTPITPGSRLLADHAVDGDGFLDDYIPYY